MFCCHCNYYNYLHCGRPHPWSPHRKTAADTSCARLCGLHKSPGWAVKVTVQELRDRDGHAASPHPLVLLWNHPKERPGVPYQHPSWNSPPRRLTSTESYCFLGPPALWGEGAHGQASYLSLSSHHQHPFWILPLCFLNTQILNLEHLSQPRRGGSRETLRDLQSEGASSRKDDGAIIRKLLGVICSQLAGGETKPAEQTQVGEGRAGRGAGTGCFGCAKVHRGNTQHIHSHTRLTEREKFLAWKQLAALCKIPPPQKYHLDDKKAI